MAGSRGFGSDNQSGIHPEVLEAIGRANVGHAPSYGADSLSAEAEGLCRQHFGESCEVTFVLNGTGANVVGLGAVLRPYEAVVCAAQAHIATDECGAPERLLGAKLLTVPTVDGKLRAELVRPLLQGFGNEHHVQPRVLSVSQPTELGTVYQPAELRALAELAHHHQMLLHVDGARLANAAAFLEVPLRAITAEVGVDVLSFGGTKNGMAFGDAVILFGQAGRGELRFVRKQCTQLASKMRFIAAQFAALLRAGLWLRLASQANAMARLLAEGARAVPGVRITQAVQANEVFAELPASWIARLQAACPFYVWDASRSEVRWVTSWDTEREDVERFVGLLGTLGLPATADPVSP